MSLSDAVLLVRRPGVWTLLSVTYSCSLPVFFLSKQCTQGDQNATSLTPDVWIKSCKHFSHCFKIRDLKKKRKSEYRDVFIRVQQGQASTTKVFLLRAVPRLCAHFSRQNSEQVKNFLFVIQTTHWVRSVLAVVVNNRGATIRMQTRELILLANERSRRPRPSIQYPA